ncbi:MAG: RIP metalloprotease RseP [Bryobacterales bacterium]|nr:RIP metalloprotease RseP [Bryobacterales bacterium]
MVLWFLLLIGVMIVIHELGHYWAARWFDIRVDTFSFGFGPRLFGFKKGETDFRVSAIPFGGYVRMAGEQPGDNNADDPRSFQAKPRWQRLIVVFGGPFMNLVLAVALLAGLFMWRFPKQPDHEVSGVVGVVLPDSAAARAGIQEGDRITGLDGMQYPVWEDIALKVLASPGQPLRVTYERAGAEKEATLVPEMDKRDGIGTAGWGEQMEIQVGGVQKGMDAERKGLRAGDVLVSINSQPIRSSMKIRETVKTSQGKPVEIVFRRDGKEQSVMVTPAEGELEGQKTWLIGVQLEPRYVFVQLGPVAALGESVKANVKSASLIYQFLHGIIERRMSPRSLEGPIRMAQISGEAAKEGLSSYLGLMAMVSLNLAIFNLLPIPILDGGSILLLLVEMIFRRDLSLQVKEAVLKFGFVFLLMVVMFVLYNDIRKIMPTGG